MSRYRDALPQLGDRPFLADGGIETTLSFLEGLELPCFATFTLLDSAEGRAALEKYFRTYIDLALRHDAGLVLETPTWRANPDWGAKLGYDHAALAEASRAAAAQLDALRSPLGPDQPPVVVSGCIGPRGDGYVADETMSAEQAERYHALQAEAFADSPADMLGAITMNYVEEAEGIARAAGAAGMPVAISFTVETDGRLPTGQPLGEAIEQVDAASGGHPAYYMLNCAHPSHFDAALDPAAPWAARLRGLRANASRMSHAELDAAEELDLGDPEALGAEYAALRERLPQLSVLGGCCGTDERHIDRIARACLPRPGARG